MAISKNRCYSWRLWQSNYKIPADIFTQETFPIFRKFLKFRSIYKWCMQIIKKKANTLVVYNFLLRSLPNPLPQSRTIEKKNNCGRRRNRLINAFSPGSRHSWPLCTKHVLILLSLIIDPFFIYISGQDRLSKQTKS